MVHRCDSGVVDENVQSALALRNLGKLCLDRPFVSNIEAIASIVSRFSLERRTATPDYVITTASVVLC